MAHHHPHGTSDFNKKQPTKNEQMFYELAMNQEVLDRRLWTTSSFVTALAFLNNADPEKIAELLTRDAEKVKVFSQKINDAIDRIEKEEQAKRSENLPKESAESAENNSETK